MRISNLGDETDELTYQSDVSVVVYPESEVDIGMVALERRTGTPPAIDLRGRIYCVDGMPVSFECVVQPGRETSSPAL